MDTDKLAAAFPCTLGVITTPHPWTAVSTNPQAQHRHIAVQRTRQSPGSSAADDSTQPDCQQKYEPHSASTTAAWGRLHLPQLVLNALHIFSSWIRGRQSPGRSQHLLPLNSRPPIFTSMNPTAAAGHAAGASAAGPVLTVRAVAAGLLVGAVLCFSNTYFGLQTGWVTMGSLQVGPCDLVDVHDRASMVAIVAAGMALTLQLQA